MIKDTDAANEDLPEDEQDIEATSLTDFEILLCGLLIKAVKELGGELELDSKEREMLFRRYAYAIDIDEDDNLYFQLLDQQPKLTTVH